MSARFDNNLISRVQQASDIVDVVSEHLRLVPKGRELVGLCPFHKDNRPSLFVNPEKQIFKCFACGAGGTVFSFVQLREGLSFPQAVERLAQRAGIEVQAAPRKPGGGAREMTSDQLARLNKWVLELWQGNLAGEGGVAAREYVASRGISGDSVEKWSLGLAVDSWSNAVDVAAKRNIPAAALVAGGLAVRRESEGLYDKFRNRLMFPITDVTGRVIAFGGRTLGNDPAKYMNSPTTPLFDKSNTVYGLQQARHAIVQSHTAVVVEGYTDCIMAHQYGIENVVATLGTSFTAGHAHLLRRYASKIVLLFDSDVAGEAASGRAMEICLQEGVDIKLAFVPEGKDPCDYLLAAGADALRSVIEDATDVLEYMWGRLSGAVRNGGSIPEQAAATRQFIQSVAAAIRSGKLDPISRGLLVNRMASMTGLSVRQLNSEIGRTTAAQDRNSSIRSENRKVVSFDCGTGWYAKAQREIIEVLLNDPSAVCLATERLVVEDFDIPALGEVAQILFDDPALDENTSISEILSRVDSPELAGFIVELHDEGQKKGNLRSRLVEAVNAMLDFKRKAALPQIEDETERLKRLTAKLKRPDPRNIGMK